jgi:hypothetical protein
LAEKVSLAGQFRIGRMAAMRFIQLAAPQVINAGESRINI